MRDYLRADELKRAGMPWQELTLAGWLTGKELLAARLRVDPSFATQADRDEAFAERAVAAGRPTTTP